MNERLVADTLRSVSADVEVGLPPVDKVVRAGQRRARNRRFAVVGAAAASIALVAGAASVIGDAGENESLPPGVVQTENPLPMPWWGDGTLHLENVTVPVAAADNLVRLKDGAAYNTDETDGDLPVGRAYVVVVDGEGRRTTVGQKWASSPMAGSVDDNWLAWVDPRDKAPQLVVYDVTAGGELGRVDLPYRGARWERLDAGSYPISIDNSRVYYATQDGDWSWSPGEAEPQRETPDNLDLEDVRGGTRVWRPWEPDQGWAERLSVTRPGSDDVLFYDSDGGDLSPDGRYLVVTSGPDAAIFPVGSRDPMALDLPVDTDVFGLNFHFTDNETLVAVQGGLPAPPPTETEGGMGGPAFAFPQYDTWDVVTCDLVTTECTTIEDLTTDSAPILAE